jgi:hypothetical protein
MFKFWKILLRPAFIYFSSLFWKFANYLPKSYLDIVVSNVSLISFSVVTALYILIQDASSLSFFLMGLGRIGGGSISFLDFGLSLLSFLSLENICSIFSLFYLLLLSFSVLNFFL